MKKKRTSPTILKPLIDEETALKFAAEESAEPAPEHTTDAPRKTASKKAPIPKGTPAKLEKDMRISLTISKDLYNRIAKEAARKSRTVEEHLNKHLAKRYDK